MSRSPALGPAPGSTGKLRESPARLWRGEPAVRRRIWLLLLAAALPGLAHAAKDLAPFPMIQEHCVAVGDISFGPGGRWPACRILRARWYATIVADNLDFYQVQYCLGAADGACEARALLLFSNRAYTPVARLVLARVDSAATRYDDPQVHRTDAGYVTQITARTEHASESNYYRWQASVWVPVPDPKLDETASHARLAPD